MSPAGASLGLGGPGGGWGGWWGRARGVSLRSSRCFTGWGGNRGSCWGECHCHCVARGPSPCHHSGVPPARLRAPRHPWVHTCVVYTHEHAQAPCTGRHTCAEVCTHAPCTPHGTPRAHTVQTHTTCAHACAHSARVHTHAQPQQTPGIHPSSRSHTAIAHLCLKTHMCAHMPGLGTRMHHTCLHPPDISEPHRCAHTQRAELCTPRAHRHAPPPPRKAHANPCTYTKPTLTHVCMRTAHVHTHATHTLMRARTHTHATVGVHVAGTMHTCTHTHCVACVHTPHTCTPPAPP